MGGQNTYTYENFSGQEATSTKPHPIMHRHWYILHMREGCNTLSVAYNNRISGDNVLRTVEFSGQFAKKERKNGRIPGQKDHLGPFQDVGKNCPGHSGTVGNYTYMYVRTYTCTYVHVVACSVQLQHVSVVKSRANRPTYVRTYTRTYICT